MKQMYEAWTSKMMESWKKLEGGGTADLFSSDVEYYETLDTPPCKSWEDVVKLWLVVQKNQRDIDYSFEIICADANCAVVNWKMNRKFISDSKTLVQFIDGIFQIKLNAEGKCTFFKQWRFTKLEE
ncbi:hypothetical protein AGMMS50212_13070 [Spirochaetia bacterium]|nr:hypothetical protein AGMMS50212_13070 [Spirochaetia bacterium]